MATVGAGIGYLNAVGWRKSSMALPVASNKRAVSLPLKTGIYGALAIDKETGAWGISDRSQNQDDAEASALSLCTMSGPNCEIVDSFSQTCVALASGTGSRVTWALADDAKQAERDAISKNGRILLADISSKTKFPPLRQGCQSGNPQSNVTTTRFRGLVLPTDECQGGFVKPPSL